MCANDRAALLDDATLFNMNKVRKVCQDQCFFYILLKWLNFISVTGHCNALKEKKCIVTVWLLLKLFFEKSNKALGVLKTWKSKC